MLRRYTFIPKSAGSSDTPVCMVQPSGSATIDTQRVLAAIEEMAGLGEVLLDTGRFRINQPLPVYSNSVIRGVSREKTILEFDISGTSTTDCGFVASPGAVWGSSTIAAVNTVGASTVSVAGKGNGTTLAASFEQPEVGETVTIEVASVSASLAVDTKIFIHNGGAYSVEELVDSTHLLVKNLGMSGNAAPGSTVASAVAVVGLYMQIRDSVSGSNFHGGAYVVKGFTGAGPYTVTVERAVNFQFGVGDLVEWPSDLVTDAIISNFTIEGAAARAIEFLTVRECTIDNINVLNWTGNGTPDLTVSLDTFSYRSLINEVFIDGNGSCPGVGLESNEGSSIKRLTVLGVSNGSIALRINDGSDCSVSDYFGRGKSSYGYGLKANPENGGNGPVRLSLVDIDLEGFSIGMELASAKEAQITNARVFSNTNYNVVFSGSSTASAINLNASGIAHVTGVYAVTFDSTYGVIIKDTSDVRLKNVDTTDTQFGVFVEAGAKLFLDGHKHIGASGTDGNAGQGRLSSLGTVIARGLEYTNWTAGARAVHGAGGEMYITDSILDGTASFVGIVSIANKIYIQNTKFSGFSSNNNVDAAAAGEVVFGPGLNISPVVASGGKVNAGTVQLNGATPFDVSLPTMLGMVAGGDARVRLRLKTVGGTQGKDPICVAGANKFTVTGTAGDTSTYAWQVD